MTNIPKNIPLYQMLQIGDLIQAGDLSMGAEGRGKAAQKAAELRAELASRKRPD